MDNLENGPETPSPRTFETGMKEVAELFLDSLWKDSVKPTVARLFSRNECHVAAQKAGTDILARLAKDDPETDKAYA